MKLFFPLFLLFFSNMSWGQTAECYDNARTTSDTNACTAERVTSANALLQKYLSAAKKRYGSDRSVVTSIDRGQAAWLAYRDAHCNSVYAMYRDGSISGAMHLGCSLQLTTERTHRLWKDYLTYWDSTPPVLPEPKKQEDGAED